MDAYLVSGTVREPTQFANDLEFKGQTQLTISSKAFPTLTSFTVAVRVNGIEYNGNVFHQHVLRAKFAKTSATTLMNKDHKRGRHHMLSSS